MLKRNMILFVAILSVFSLLIPVNINASEEICCDLHDASEEKMNGFDDFLTSIIDEETFYAEDKKGIDITETIRNMYFKNGCEAVHRYFINNNGSFGYEQINTRSVESGLMAVQQSVTVSDIDYVIATDTTGNNTKEWATKLTGTYYCDGNTGLINRACSPTLSLWYDGFGTAFVPYMNSITTNSRVINQSYAVFSANYHMYADCATPVGALSYDYGTHQHQFTAS